MLTSSRRNDNHNPKNHQKKCNENKRPRDHGTAIQYTPPVLAPVPLAIARSTVNMRLRISGGLGDCDGVEGIVLVVDVALEIGFRVGDTGVL